MSQNSVAAHVVDENDQRQWVAAAQGNSQDKKERSKSEEVSLLRSQLENLNFELTKKDSELKKEKELRSKAEADLAELKSKNEASEKANLEALEKIRQLEVDLDLANKLTLSLNDEKASLVARNAELAKDLESSKKNPEAALKIKALAVKLAAQQQEVINLRDELESQTSLVTKLKARNIDSEAAKHEATDRLDESLTILKSLLFSVKKAQTSLSDITKAEKEAFIYKVDNQIEVFNSDDNKRELGEDAVKSLVANLEVLKTASITVFDNLSSLYTEPKLAVVIGKAEEFFKDTNDPVL